MKKSLASLMLLFLVGLLAAFQTVPSPGPGRKLLAAGGGSGTFSFLQLTGPPSRVYFNRGLDTGTYPITAITSGSYGTASLEDNWDGTMGQRRMTAFYDCNASPCGVGNSNNVWTIQHGCEGYFQGTGGNAVSVAAATAGPLVGGATFVTVVRDGHSPTNLENFSSMFVELTSTTAATVENVALNGEDHKVNHTMVATSLSGGNNHAVVQFVTTGGGPSTITAPYNSHFFGFSPAAHYAAAVAINITDGTAPTWTDASSQSAAGCAVNWKD